MRAGPLLLQCILQVTWLHGRSADCGSRIPNAADEEIEVQRLGGLKADCHRVLQCREPRALHLWGACDLVPILRDHHKHPIHSEMQGRSIHDPVDAHGDPLSLSLSLFIYIYIYICILC